MNPKIPLKEAKRDGLQGSFPHSLLKTNSFCDKLDPKETNLNETPKRVCCVFSYTAVSPKVRDTSKMVCFLLVFL